MKVGDKVSVKTTSPEFRTGVIVKHFRHRSVVKFDYNGVEVWIKNDDMEVIE